MAERKKILLLTGSMNQTLQMVKIAEELREYDCWFSQVFSDSAILNFFIKHTRLLNRTIISDTYRRQSEAYLSNQGYQIDYGARINRYDMIVCCTDMIIPEKLLKSKTVWVQEGMIDKSTWTTYLVKRLKLSPLLCFNTSLNGATNTCDIYCAASEGYKARLAFMGTEEHKITVTGMPNYDHLVQHTTNNFPHRDYVMVATTDMRETSRWENRPAFIRKCVAIANGRQLLFKLHPNEKQARAVKEIRRHAPESAMIYTEGNTNDMIANCQELITQYSTVVYTGIALGKKVHSLFDVEELKLLLPQQNNGTSAIHIATICRDFIEFDGNSLAFARRKMQAPDARPATYHSMKTLYAG